MSTRWMPAAKRRVHCASDPEGTNVLTSKDSRGFEFVREMLDRKSGTVRYDWASPGEAQPRERMTVFDHYPGWDWVVASGSYTDEISREADSAVRNIALMSLAIIVAALVSGFVATRVWVTRPLQEVMGEADRIAAGDLTGHLTVDHADEVGRLKQAIGKMAEHLKTTIGEVRGTSGTMLEGLAGAGGFSRTGQPKLTGAEQRRHRHGGFG